VKYVFDASAIVNLVKKASLKHFLDGVTLDLAIYESLNAVLKEHHLLRKLDDDLAARYVGILIKIFGVIEVRSVKGYEHDVYKIAGDHGLTIYDSSYVALALKNKLVLVTDDKQLRSKAGDLVNTLTTEDLIKIG